LDIGGILLIILLLIVLVFILKLNKTFRLQDSISKYTIYSKKSKNYSILDNLEFEFNSIIDYLSFNLIKIRIFDNYVKKYKKYNMLLKNKKNEYYYFLSFKIIITIIVFILVSIYNFINYNIFINYISVISFFSFLLLNVVYKIKMIYIKNQIQKDLLNVVIIMNNQFKSNKTLIQAIEKVILETKGHIKNEFEIIYKDLKYGLGVDVAFKRFYERIDLEDVKYISSSLIIFSTTGGNIISVFKSIEKTLINKNKTYLELNAVISNAKAMSKILLFVPIFFVILIYYINPTYFNPFFSSLIGIILLILIVLLYILYIVVIKNLIKVKL